jgi:hypothetical protein
MEINLTTRARDNNTQRIRKHQCKKQKKTQLSRKMFLVHELEEFIIVKWPGILKEIYRLMNPIPVKILLTFFTEIEKNLHFLQNHRRL